MNDNEFSIPFERAFKRLRVDAGDLPADDASDGEDCSRSSKSDLQSTRRSDTSSLTSNDVPCGSFSSGEMWRPVDQPAFAELPVSEQSTSVSSFLRYHQFKSASPQPNASDCQHRPTMDERLKRSKGQRSADDSLNDRSLSKLSLNDKPSIGQLFSKSTDRTPFGDLHRTKPKSSSSSELTQNCSNQARNEPDVNVNELAAYLECQLFLPKKMSFMASLAYS